MQVVRACWKRISTNFFFVALHEVAVILGLIGNRGVTEFASAIAIYFSASEYFDEMEFCRRVRLHVWYRGDCFTLGDGVTLEDVAESGGM